MAGVSKAQSSLALLTEVVSLLASVADEEQLSKRLDEIMPLLLSVCGLTDGAFRIVSASSHADIMTDSGTGAARFCFHSLDAPVCVCGQALYRDDDLVITAACAEPACRDAGFTTILCCAIRVEGKKEGLFLAGGGDELSLSEETGELIQAICRHIGGRWLVSIRPFPRWGQEHRL